MSARASGGVPAAYLFRGQVARGAENGSGGSLRHAALRGRAHGICRFSLRGRLQLGLPGGSCAIDFGDAPVDHIHFSKVAEQDVAGFDVAMHDAVTMGVGNRQANAAEGREQSPTCETFGKLHVAPSDSAQGYDRE